MKRTIPEGLDANIENDSILIRRKWFSLKTIPLIFFCIAWDSFLVFWYSTVTKSESSMDLLAIIFPIGHVAVGVGLTYFCIASLFNKTDIRISPRLFSARSYPIPWIGNTELKVDELHAVVVRERTSGGYNQSSFTVMYVDAQNKEKKLVRSLQHIEQANFIRDEISDLLNIDKIES